jgi:hypothetical protein
MRTLSSVVSLSHRNGFEMQELFDRKRITSSIPQFNTARRMKPGRRSNNDGSENSISNLKMFEQNNPEELTQINDWSPAIVSGVTVHNNDH